MTSMTEEPRALTDLTQRYCDSIEQPTQAEIDRGLHSLLDRVDSGRKRRRLAIRWSLLTAGFALSALTLVQLATRGLPSGSDSSALTYQIDGGSVVEGGYLRELSSTGMQVRFNEGSHLALTPGTRGRIRAVDKDGARLAIERGTASLQVTPNEARRWLVDVGPFLVTVKGTVFTVSWDPVSEQFELNLRHGRVVVSGPVSAGEIALRTGQRLVVNLAKTESVISEIPSEAHPAEALPTPEPAPGVQPLVDSERPVAARPALKAVNDRRWSNELARGHWDRILDEARSMGIDTALAKSSSEDLFALADAARYRRQPDLARAALTAERRRFPGSPRALDAIFLLGRVEELREHGAAQAISWYDEYLTRAPAGPFVGEALGRKMTLIDRVEGPARARPLAEEYLRRFPKGNYAGAARTLLRAP